MKLAKSYRVAATSIRAIHSVIGFAIVRISKSCLIPAELVEQSNPALQGDESGVLT
jgi:hypothetical protein